jgi:succinate-semialdehyde dehydrogenase / glutarate-semialdehyde dehydrogenase
LQNSRRARGAWRFEPMAGARGRLKAAFTTSAQTATAIGDALEAGMVGVNSVAISTPETPFGGVKESGYGSEGGIEGLQAYLNTKFISQG